MVEGGADLANSFLQQQLVDKVILVGVPNEGSVFLNAYERLYAFLVNKISRYNGLFNINSNIVKTLKTGLVTPRVPGVNYYVIAGTNPFQFGSLTAVTEINKTHDGLVSVESAQRVGDDYVNDRCNNFWDINVTHLELIHESAPRKLIEKVVAKEILDKGIETAMGNTQFFETTIARCSPEDRYILIGKRVEPKAKPDATGCSCGNGVCGIGEDQTNCPRDCFQLAFKESNLKLLLKLLALLIVYGVTHRFHRWGYRKPPVTPKGQKGAGPKTFSQKTTEKRTSLAHEAPLPETMVQPPFQESMEQGVEEEKEAAKDTRGKKEGGIEKEKRALKYNSLLKARHKEMSFYEECSLIDKEIDYGYISLALQDYLRALHHYQMRLDDYKELAFQKPHRLKEEIVMIRLSFSYRRLMREYKKLQHLKNGDKG